MSWTAAASRDEGAAAARTFCIPLEIEKSHAHSLGIRLAAAGESSLQGDAWSVSLRAGHETGRQTAQ